MLGEGLGKKMKEKWLFYIVGHICSLQDLPRKIFVHLGELIQLRLAWVKFFSPERILLQQILLL